MNAAQAPVLDLPFLPSLLCFWFEITCLFLKSERIYRSSYFHLRPEAPQNGLIRVEGPLTVGKMMKFHCNPGFMMKGQPIMTCSEAVDNGESFGKWIGEVYSVL